MATGVIPKGTGQKGFTAACFTRNNDIKFLFDKGTAGECPDGFFIYLSLLSIVNVLDTGIYFTLKNHLL